MLSTWLSPRDGIHLIGRALDAPGVHFEIVYGASANDRGAPRRSIWGRYFTLYFRV